MEKRKITCEIEVAKTLEELSIEEQELVAAAKSALKLSYSPYSNFQVGAAARMEKGAIVKGANQENASYPLCLCAERSVLAITSNSFMGEKVRAMAITVNNPNQVISEPASPCGACRQVLTETENRQKSPIRLLLTTEAGETWIIKSAHAILPLAFNGEFLA